VLRWVVQQLAEQPFITLFLVVAAGYALGAVKVKGICLGSTAATLIVALVLSLIAAQCAVAYKIPEFASTVFFNLFIFSVGMKVGPQFLAGIRRDAKRFVIIAVMIPFLSLGLMLLMQSVLELQPGMSAGIFAGANTATPGLGAAQAAIESAHPGNADTLIANMSTAFAFTYCLSVVIFAVMIKLPDILGANTTAAARAYEKALAQSDIALPGTNNGLRPTGDPRGRVLRAYEVSNLDAVGRSLGELRRYAPELSIERVLRDGQPVQEGDEELRLQLGDVVTLYGYLPRLMVASEKLGREVADPEALEVDDKTVDVVVCRAEAIGHTLREIATGVGYGLYLNAMFRGGAQMHFEPSTVVEKGDILRVTGSSVRIARLETGIGEVVHPSVSTDIVTLALGLALGALLGALTIHAGGIALRLGSAVGLLVVGMGLSILRTRRPAFGGPYPEPARQLIEDLGLNVFVAVLGLNAGAGLLGAIGSGAMGPLLITCFVVGFIPPIAAYLIGHYAMKMNDALLMGAVAGGRCNSPAMRTAQETTKSWVPTVSYPATFAIANVLFTLMAYFIAVRG
jgi:putative transport protein